MGHNYIGGIIKTIIVISGGECFTRRDVPLYRFQQFQLKNRPETRGPRSLSDDLTPVQLQLMYVTYCSNCVSRVVVHSLLTSELCTLCKIEQNDTYIIEWA